MTVRIGNIGMILVGYSYVTAIATRLMALYDVVLCYSLTLSQYLMSECLHQHKFAHFVSDWKDCMQRKLKLIFCCCDASRTITCKLKCKLVKSSLIL